jgi:hypothetical protein
VSAEDLIEEITPAISELSLDERVRFFRALEAGWCRHCGRPTQAICHCNNDE